ncbi:MAG TPA: BamA/TamA family outer membrane protein [Polyangiaceae bacterium]|nr:BamA/TamA family outer membrane protein [Polyangiaceae bacterium]
MSLVEVATSTARAADGDDEEHKDKQSEFTAVPFAGGDSDVGFGGGFIASWARLAGYDPYLLRVEAATAVTFKRPDDAWAVPYTDAYVLIDAPHVVPDRMRLRLRISYTREQRLPYSGLGNASQRVPDSEDEQSRYTRIHPTADLQTELSLTKALHVLMGVNYTPNQIDINPASRLAHDMNMGSDDVRRLLGDAHDHSVILFSYGVTIDTRDNLVNPRSGFFATARVDLSPGESGVFTHRWARANTSVRGFVPLIPSRLTLAGRVVTDWLFGDAPFYELPRYDATSAIGGASGVRGIPAQRYFGKIKAFGNVELRSELVKMKLLGKETTWGITGFFDTGRVWADYEAHPELDGTSLGLKYGTGAGLRIASGKSFVLRFDVAWSRESNPVSAYLISGHSF